MTFFPRKVYSTKRQFKFISLYQINCFYQNIDAVSDLCRTAIWLAHSVRSQPSRVHYPDIWTFVKIFPKELARLSVLLRSVNEYQHLLGANLRWFIRLTLQKPSISADSNWSLASLRIHFPKRQNGVPYTGADRNQHLSYAIIHNFILLLVINCLSVSTLTSC